MRKYQTISQFISSPFNRGGGDASEMQRFEDTFNKLSSEGKIKAVHACKVVDSYFIHIKVASESTSGSLYDVVVKFFTDNKKVESDAHLRNYYLQFFSNSPSFIYKYAYLYNKNKYLIEALYNKLDADYINTPPNISNEKMKMSYDKSLYCACRYLADTKATHLDKSGYILSHLTDVDTFFNGISDFKSIKFEQALIKAEQKVMKEIEAENRDLNDGRTGLNIKTSKVSRSAIKNRANKIVGGHKVGKIHGRRK